MPEYGVPIQIPSATAAAIAGVPPARFRRQYVKTGLVNSVEARGSLLVDTASLEDATGKPISCRSYCLAERQRDVARDYQREYRDRHAAPSA
jgi:hypothetical protein